jgi:hypothetical protein
MLTPEEERFVSANAYVPEHVVGLMAAISGGEPFLLEDYLCYVAADSVIIVGYPLDRTFSVQSFETFLNSNVRRFSVDPLWIAAPQIPPRYAQSCGDYGRDRYYTLNLDGFATGGRLRRETAKARHRVTVTVSRSFGPEHEDLVKTFITREEPGALVSSLYGRMKRYVAASSAAAVLEGRDKLGVLTAFYVVDMEAERFATYIVGCHSKEHYVPHASDLLFLHMVQLAQREGKQYIHLGLSVNAGIRRFKEKWGGVSSLNYECCRYGSGIRRPLSILSSLESIF